MCRKLSLVQLSTVHVESANIMQQYKILKEFATGSFLYKEISKTLLVGRNGA